MQNEEVRSWEYEIYKMQNYLWDWFGTFLKLLEVKIHYHEIEVCHMFRRFRRIMN